MSRRQPVVAITDICAGVVLDPNGAHRLVVENATGIVGMRFNRDQLDQLEAAIAAARVEMVAADAGPDFYKTKFKPLEIK